jgi:hypothetical protein
MNAKKQFFLACTCVLASITAHAQFVSSVVTDSDGLMWANTVGIGRFWDPSSSPGSAQAWVAGLNSSDYGGFDDWALATGDGNVTPNTMTNQLGELFYTDCGNSVGSFTSLSSPGKNCSALTTVQAVIDTAANASFGGPFDLFLSATPDHSLDELLGGGQLGFWGYTIDTSTQRSLTNDTVFHGSVDQGDALAVRAVTQAPEIDPTSLASALTLLAGCVAVMRGRHRHPSPSLP